MALRVLHGERASVIKWMEGLRAKYELGSDAQAIIDEVAAKQKACLKKIKQAIKEATGSKVNVQL